MKKIEGYVHLNSYYLKEVPEILNDVIITDYLDLSENKIKNLTNFPLSAQSIYLMYNPLTSLVGIKQKKVESLDLNGTKIINLEGCPEEVQILHISYVPTFNSLQGSLKKITSYGSLKITNTSLQSLENFPVIENRVSINLVNNKINSLIGMPKKCHDLQLTGNPLRNMIGGPEHLTGDLFLFEHNLENFDGFPRVIEGDVSMSTSIMFNNPLMKSRGYFTEQLLKRCKVYGNVYINDRHYEQI